MRRSTIMTIIFLAILGLIAYLWYGYWQKPGSSTETAASAEDFSKTLAQVSRLKNLTLDTSFFKDRFFTELEEPRQIPEPEVAPGRPNPFAAFK